MPRIIAGALGGRTIAGPPTSRTRPTSDRVREAIFSRLQTWGAISDQRVLDLYAGTGALAFEALSRGAASAVLVEAHARTARQISATAADLGLDARARVMTARVETAVENLAQGVETGQEQPFGLVFCDPPYDLATESLREILERLSPALGSEALVVIERSNRSAGTLWPESMIEDDVRAYGDTSVHYGGPGGADTVAR